MAGLPCNKFRGDKGKIILVLLIRTMLLVQGEIQQVDNQELLNAITAKVKDIWLGNALSQSDQGMLHGIRRMQYCDDLSTAQAVLMANISNYGSDIISEVVQIVLWYLDSGCSKHMTGNRSQLMNFVSNFLGTVRFRNDQIARIMGYGDYQLGNVIISRVYYFEGLGHNLFSVGQFCDADLEVAFQKNTCFIQNLEGVDLLISHSANHEVGVQTKTSLLLRIWCVVISHQEARSSFAGVRTRKFLCMGDFERISKNRTKKQSQNDKIDSEWKKLLKDKAKSKPKRCNQVKSQKNKSTGQSSKAKIEAVNLSQHKHKKHNKRPGTSIKERDEQVVWSS
ncbi:hypothetical protein Tco_0627180 [Tanacetum coccineum]|uniref:Retrovirus-related Pol polyprotein from transposon TNT 1-94-like beta-barrel domain-containing protein n=1 Tax=Tanacetum coccineum TaxID=301880 RepID=A0ABQ4WLR9_9ASTR